MSQSVYQKVLGAEFLKLSPVLQFVHSDVAEIRASGKIDVVYGKGAFIKMFNRMNKMPPEGKNQQLILEVKRFEDKETWKRSFNGKIFSTDQYESKGFLIERDKVIVLGFCLTIKDGSLYFEQKFTKFAGIRLPKFLGIFSTASATEENNGWKVEVGIRSPILGLLLKYNGVVQLEKGLRPG